VPGGYLLKRRDACSGQARFHVAESLHDHNEVAFLEIFGVETRAEGLIPGDLVEVDFVTTPDHFPHIIVDPQRGDFLTFGNPKVARNKCGIRTRELRWRPTLT
jgi:hypothetical protein